MRTPSAVALVLAVACGRADRRPALPAHGAATRSIARVAGGPDPIVLRMPRTGGIARAFVYPRLDSAVWTSPGAVPGADRLLGFDAEAGSVAYVDVKGLPRRVDLRLGTAAAASTAKLGALTSADGSTLYGVMADGAVMRLTPSGAWVYRPPRRVREVYPLADGSVILGGDRGAQAALWKIHPPDDRTLDSAAAPRSRRAALASAGDRLYLASDTALVGVRTRDLTLVPSVRFPRPVRAFVTTPSGDRVYVAIDSSATLGVIDRYRESIDHTIALPGAPGDLRIDALGRYLLVRPLKGDSAWLVAVGTDRLIGSFATAWRPDLPAVAIDGSVVAVKGGDVALLDPESLREVRRVSGGAADSWVFMSWEGFRPRAPGLDQPVTFANSDTTFRFSTDSGALRPPASPDSGIANGVLPTPPPGTGPPVGRDSAGRPRSAGPGFTVSFAALLTEEGARATAAQIRTGRDTARVVPSQRGAQTIYRVVLGPYPTRADAERVAREANHSYWIYEGNP